MKAAMEWLMGMFSRKAERPDEGAIRDQMAREDPDFARVREVQHDALNTIGASRTVHDLKDRFAARSRDAWRGSDDAR